MPNKPKRQPKKIDAFEVYKRWKLLPFILLGKPIEHLKILGVEDSDLLNLANIKTQTDFAQRFGIKDLGTLTDWNKRLETDAEFQGMLEWRKSSEKRMLRNLMYATVSRLFAEPEAHGFKIIAQYLGEWPPQPATEKRPPSGPMLILDEGDIGEPI